MKKAAIISFLTLVSFAIVTFFLALCFFHESLQSILQEITYSILTGCIFAIPSTGMLLIVNSVRSKEKEFQLLYCLNRMLLELEKKIKDNSLSEKEFQKNLAVVHAIYSQLKEITLNNLILNREHDDLLNNIQGSLFNIIYRLNIFTNRTSFLLTEYLLTEKDDTINELLPNIQSCIVSIKEWLDLDNEI